jgi:hypothetical protein
MKVGPAIEHVQAVEIELANELRRVAERHASQHDVFHMGHILADRCDAIAKGLTPFVEEYGKRARETNGDDGVRPLAERVRRTISAAVGRSEQTGLLLLRDLRDLYVLASETEIDWTIARQGALAARDTDLAISCLTGMQETERIVRWLKTRIKESAPQTLVS